MSHTDQHETSGAEEPRKNAAYGSIIGIVVIVAVLVAGAFYVWNDRVSEQPAEAEPETGVSGNVIIESDFGDGGPESIPEGLFSTE